MSEEYEYILRIARLIIKYHRDELAEEESLELKVWLAQSAQNQALFDRLSDPQFIKDSIRELPPDIKSLKAAGWERVIAVIGEEQAPAAVTPSPVRRMKWSRLFAAASLAGLLSFGVWLYITHRSVAVSNVSPSLASNIKNDVAPGGNKAILTLADGTAVVLDSTGIGTVARQGNITVIKKSSGVLSYAAASPTDAEASAGASIDAGGHPAGITAPLAFNSLVTPASGQFQLTLPDGSRVYLNNASSLRYPVAFTGKDRVVELQGEAFFEVAKNADRPFRVRVGETMVDVLGTSFNISAYSNERSIRATLLSGSVRFSRGAGSVLLKPGEQAVADNSRKDAITTLSDMDTDGVVSWKNGLFHFEKADIQTVMRMLARWYDVEVVYEGKVTDHLFGGDIQRNLNLSQVLEILQKNQVHFDLEGRKLTVRP